MGLWLHAGKIWSFDFLCPYTESLVNRNLFFFLTGRGKFSQPTGIRDKMCMKFCTINYDTAIYNYNKTLLEFRTYVQSLYEHYNEAEMFPVWIDHYSKIRLGLSASNEGLFKTSHILPTYSKTLPCMWNIFVPLWWLSNNKQCFKKWLFVENTTLPKRNE